MRIILLTALFALLGITSYSQGQYGLMLGTGFTTAYTSHYTPTLDGYFLTRLTRSIYAGGALSYRRYSFEFDKSAGNPAYGDVLSIKQKSSYLYFAPRIDLGVGYRKRFHFYFALGPGILLAGNKETSYYEPLYQHTGPPTGGDTVTYNTNASMRTLIFNYAVGVTYRLPLGYWNVIFCQEFSYITSKLNYPGTNLNTSFLNLSVGLVHKYPQVAVEY